MAERYYHAFWREPAGGEIRHLATYSDSEIAALRKKADGEWPDVRDLYVVYGVMVEFEPIRVVEAYRIKDQDWGASAMTIAVNKDDILNRCQRLCLEHITAVDPDRVKPSASFIEDLGCDSLDMVELVMAAEEEFNIEISDDEGMAMVTVQNAVDAIAQKLS